MIKKSLQVMDSTLDSLGVYEYEWDGVVPKIGSTVILVNSETGKKKVFKVEYAKIEKGGLVLKNTNNTLVLKEVK